MSYQLSDFCSDLNRILKARGLDGIEELAEKLKLLLANREFVSENFNDDMPKGKRKLHHDSESDAYVYAHVHLPGGRGKPHSHGDSWAIYGNASGCTVMTEWARVSPAGAEQTELKPVAHYSLRAGEAKAYGPHVIHSTQHPEKAWVIRITGTNLAEIPRYHFNPETDRLLEDA